MTNRRSRLLSASSRYVAISMSSSRSEDSLIAIGFSIRRPFGQVVHEHQVRGVVYALVR
jgi:hypothetical protein